MNWSTHEVSNQPPELGDINLYEIDVLLREGVRRAGAGAQDASLSRYGALLGRHANFALAQDANRYGPELQTYDAQGHRVDLVHFHPAWLHFMGLSFGQGLHCSAWAEPGAGAHAARAAAFLMHGQIEAGSLCPTTMTAASIPILRKESWFHEISPLLYARHFDGRDMPLDQKTSMSIGMGMTEKQGGSDLRSNATFARPVGAAGRARVYALTGHKWFFSAPTSDAHLVLARTQDAFSCFYVPRWRSDGRRNGVRLQRLKDKLGNKSNASGEVEFQEAEGILIGEPGRGIATLVEMASYTRLDCVLGSAALMRRGLVVALHHTRHRYAFGKLLRDQPLMQGVLADLALESMAATLLALRLAGALDAPDDPGQQAWRRVMAPAAKFWICKRAVSAVAECMEVLGGNGYIEQGDLARLYREAPVNAIWEGSGNIMCLDVLRALGRDPAQSQAVLDALAQDCHGDDRLMRRLGQLRVILADQDALPARARRVARDLVLLAQAGLMRRFAPSVAANNFVMSRFSGDQEVFGLGSLTHADARALLGLAWPD